MSGRTALVRDDAGGLAVRFEVESAAAADRELVSLPGDDAFADAPPWARALAAKLEHAIAEVRAPRPPAELSFLTSAQAAAYCNFSADGDAFRLWATRWAVKPSGHNCWSVARLNAGLERFRLRGERKRKPREKKEGAP